MLNRNITRKPGRREERCSDKFVAIVSAIGFFVCCLIVAIIENLPE